MTLFMVSSNAGGKWTNARSVSDAALGPLERFVRRRAILSAEPQPLVWDIHDSSLSVDPRNQPIAHASCIVSIARQPFL